MVVGIILVFLLFVIMNPKILGVFGFVELNKDQNLEFDVTGLDKTKAYEIAQDLRSAFIFHNFDRYIEQYKLILTKRDMTEVYLAFGSINYEYGEYDLSFNIGSEFDLYDALRHYFNWHTDKINHSTIELLKQKLLLDGYSI